MKKILLLFIMIISFLFIDVYATSDSFVNDNCGVLDNDTISYINEYSNELLDKLNIEYRVVIYDDISGYSIEDYTDFIYGNLISTDSGILIFVSYKDRMIRVKTEGELADKISDTVIDNYINLYFMPFLKNNEWDSGIRNGYTSFYKLICNIYDVELNDTIVYDDLDFITKYKNIIFLIVIWLNTLISYVMCKYFINVYKKNLKLGFFDSLFFGIVLFINILLLVFIYNIDFLAASIIFILELVMIYSNITSEGLKNSSSKRRSGVRKTTKR